jgi:hypothetical protein
MSKLHQLIAVDATLKGKATATLKDLTHTFKSKAHLFSGHKKVFYPSADGQETSVESELAVNTNVPKELEWITAMLAPAFDNAFQIALGNSSAKADVMLSGNVTFLSGIPATALLELDKRLTEIQLFVQAIPTLDPAKGFKPADDQGHGIYEARTEKKARTAKQQKALVLYPATPEHPAQTQLISEDVKVGDLVSQEWSGLITVTAKGDMLDRVEELRVAVKRALSKANDTNVDTNSTIGSKVLGYIFKGTK